MTLDDLKALPIAAVCAPDAACFLWATAPLLPEGLALLHAWGFKFRTVAFTWAKRTRANASDKWHMGMGHWTRGNAEFVLLGTRGRPGPVANRATRSLVEAPVGAHSAKPAIVRLGIATMFPHARRLELFARERAEGWDATGLELDGVDVRAFLAAAIGAQS